MRKKVFSILFALAITLPFFAQIRVIYPNIEERSGSDYGYRVLRLALDKSGMPFTLEISPARINMDRAKVLLDRGEISVLDFGTSEGFEERWETVYFPIDRGLSGYRLLLVHESLSDAFGAIKNLQTLSLYTAGQGSGWSDVAILQDSGIQVVEVPLFESLFRMVNAQRFDFLPLGVEEIYVFQDRYADKLQNSVVQPDIALHYPFARLFFVQKGNTELAKALQTGLKRAFRDGSFIRLFQADESFGKALALGELEKRIIIELNNPNLSGRFRAIPQEYFWVPGSAGQPIPEPALP